VTVWIRALDWKTQPTGGGSSVKSDLSCPAGPRSKFGNITRNTTHLIIIIIIVIIKFL